MNTPSIDTMADIAVAISWAGIHFLAGKLTAAEFTAVIEILSDLSKSLHK